MSPYDFPGLVAGLAGAWLLVGAAAVALVAGLRLLAVRRRQGKGRLARAALAFAGVVAAAGVGVFLAAELTPARRALDRHAGAVAGLVLLLGLAAGWRAARRRAPAAAAAPGPAPETPPTLPPAA